MQKKCRNVGQNNEKITNRADLNGGEISVPFVHEQLVGIEFPASPPRRPETFFFSLRTVSYKNEFSVILHSLWNFSEGDADPDFKEHTLLINALNRIFAGFITTHWSPPSGPWPENIFVSCSPHFFTNSKSEIYKVQWWRVHIIFFLTTKLLTGLDNIFIIDLIEFNIEFWNIRFF